MKIDPIGVSLDLAKRLYEGGVITTALIRQEFGVSAATAKRYMVRLEARLPVIVELAPTDSGGGRGQLRKQLRLLHN